MEVLQQRAGSLNIKQLLLVTENKISQVKEFSTFPCKGRSSRASPKSCFLLSSQLSGGEGNGTPLQYSCLENLWMEELGRLQSMGSLRVGYD